LKTAFTRSGKQSVFAFLDDAAKSAQRFYINNFQDKGRYVVLEAELRNTPKRIRMRLQFLTKFGGVKSGNYFLIPKQK
jgi:hypothetical protein